MATVTTLANSASTAVSHVGYASNVKVPYLIENEIDWAEALTAKGSALADNDVIEVLRIPAGSVILGAGAQVVTAVDATTATVDFGVTGGDVDEWVDGLDIKATAGTHSTQLAVSPNLTTVSTADTLDALLLTVTGTLSTGKTRFWAIVLDISQKKAPGLAQPGT